MNDHRSIEPAKRQSLTQFSTPSEIPVATLKEANDELLACLTLVAPGGMTGEERAGWVMVARQTLTGIPADLLKRGCEKARTTCRFASEIVPTIVGEVQREWNRRKAIWAEKEAREANRNAPRLAEPEYVDAAQLRELLKSIGGGQ